MTPAETLALTRFVRAVCPQQKFDEYTPDSWYELLADLAFADANTAVRTLTKQQIFVSPAEIRAEVRRIRAARIADAGNEDPDYDRDDVLGGITAIRTHRRAIGDGNPPPRPRPLPGNPRPDDVKQLCEATLAKLPAMPAGRPQPNPDSWPAAQAARALRAVRPPVVRAGRFAPVDGPGR